MYFRKLFSKPTHNIDIVFINLSLKPHGLVLVVDYKIDLLFKPNITIKKHRYLAKFCLIIWYCYATKVINNL